MVRSQYCAQTAAVNRGWRASDSVEQILHFLSESRGMLPRTMSARRSNRARVLAPTSDADLRQAVTAAQGALNAWLRDVIVGATGRSRPPRKKAAAELPSLLLAALDTGLGKTTMTARALARLVGEIRATGRPVVYLVDSYARMSELEAVFAAIEADGLYNAMGVAPLTTGRWTGLARGGCLRGDLIERVAALGQSASGLCTGRDAEGAPVTCRHAAQCPLRASRERLAERAPDVVFMVHRFARGDGGELPDALKRPLLTVLDERPLAQLVGIARLDRAVLLRPRSSRPEHADTEALRRRAAAAVDAALGCGDDPARALVRAFGDARSAQAACHALRAHCAPKPSFGPNATDEQILSAAKRQATGAAAEERRLWTLLQGRIARLERGDARHECLSVTLDGTHVELAWREGYTWAETPTLVLDATADLDEYDRHFGGTHDIQLLTPDRRLIGNQAVVWVHIGGLTKSSLIPQVDASDDERAKAAAMKALVADALASIDALMAPHLAEGQRLLAVGAKAVVQETLAEAFDGARWDCRWYGGQRGCDAHRTAAGVVLIGRPELPQSAYRAYARAWTHDLSELDAPRPGGNSFPYTTEPRALEMRDGATLTSRVSVRCDAWEALCQRQYRENEMLQALGRTRPLRREATSLAWIVGDVVPEGVVVDLVIRAEDLIALVPRAAADADTAAVHRTAQRPSAPTAIVDLSAVANEKARRAAAPARDNSPDRAACVVPFTAARRRWSAAALWEDGDAPADRGAAETRDEAAFSASK